MVPGDVELSVWAIRCSGEVIVRAVHVDDDTVDKAFSSDRHDGYHRK
jgi:hypothetical protein